MALVEPSRPTSGYWMWLSDHRKELEKEAGAAKGSIVAKLAGQKWKELKDDARKPYEQKASDAKAAYEKAMEAFKAAGGQPGKRGQEKKDAKNARADKKAKKEAKLASGKPKRPASAFWLWQTESRDALVKEAGTNSIAVLGKLAGEKWKTLPEDQKKTYEQKAEVLKAEHAKALEEWKTNSAANPAESEVQKHGDEQGQQTTPSKRKKAGFPEKSPTAKKAKVGARGKAARSADSAPSKSAKGAAGSDSKSSLDDVILAEAEKLGYKTSIMNLAARPDVAKGGFTGRQILDSLKNCEGLVNKAKHLLLGGA